MSTCEKGELRHSHWIPEHTDLQKDGIFDKNGAFSNVDALLMNEFLPAVDAGPTSTA